MLPLSPVSRSVLTFVVAGLGVATGPAAADAAPDLLVGRPSVQAAGSRAATVRGTLAPAPARRRLAYHFALRRLGGAWTRTPRRVVYVDRRRTVTATVAGLSPGTTYALRLVATTCGGCRSGTRRGPQRVFRTSADPLPAPLVSPPRPAPPAPSPTALPVAPAPAATAAPAPSAGPAPAPPAATDPPAGSYRNPVWNPREFPDPTVIRAGSSYYAYATGDRFAVMRSPDLVHWERLAPALPARPTWAVARGDWHPWAPSVLPTTAPCPGATEGGCYLLFHVALSDRFATATTNCVGVATSATPEGPFTDHGPLEQADETREGGWPVGCGDRAGYGNIDPQPFVDEDGKAWLYVSTDFSCTDACRLGPEISVIPLADDLVHASGARRPLLAGLAGSWEQAPWAPVVENPWIVKRGSTYHLLYSGGSWQGQYGMGHAVATSPTGPFTRTAVSPWAQSSEAVKSMGGGMVIRDGAGAQWLAYHGRDASLEVPRTLRIDPLVWPDEDPKIDGPSTDIRTAPTP